MIFKNASLSWEIVMLSLSDNRTSCHPIQSVIILVINKSYSASQLPIFVSLLYGYTPNWTPLSPITIINQTSNRPYSYAGSCSKRLKSFVCEKMSCIRFSYKLVLVPQRIQIIMTYCYSFFTTICLNFDRIIFHLSTIQFGLFYSSL